MQHSLALKTFLQCMCDHLPEDDYERYFHNQASEFAVESRIFYEDHAGDTGPEKKVRAEFILPEGSLTLVGYGRCEYTALKDALNVFAPSRTPLK